MKRFLLPYALFSLALFFFMATPAHAGQATDTVQSFYNTLTETMKQGPELGFEGRVKKLEPALSKAFDLPFMARYAVGPAWSKAPKEEQEKLVASFMAFSVATYASRFTKYDGEKFEVLGEKPMTGKNTVMVETILTPKDAPPVSLNYMLKPDETGTLRIVDVYLDASISELATRRSEFGSVVKREGFPALLNSLAEKAKNMGLDKPS